MGNTECEIEEIILRIRENLQLSLRDKKRFVFVWGLFGIVMETSEPENLKIEAIYIRGTYLTTHSEAISAGCNIQELENLIAGFINSLSV